MNAALAMWGDHVYIGNRTDGSSGHSPSGVLVVDIQDPSQPAVVGEIEPPDESVLGQSTRELRVWPEEGLLVVQSFECYPIDHGCSLLTSATTPFSIRFYDLAADPVDPPLISTYTPSTLPHEFFLWLDPDNPQRALLYSSTLLRVLVTDISDARAGEFREIASWRTSFPDRGSNDTLHSLSVSDDGRRAYLAFMTAGFFIVDNSEVADGVENPEIRMATPVENRVRWPGDGVHSAVKVPGRELVLTTDEVYGVCPWGWARLIDVADESAPRVLSEYRVSPYNDPAFCEDVSSDREELSSFSSHNPTVTENLAFVTWHSAGLQAFSTEDPRHPTQVAELLPEPLAEVANEDPLLSSGPEKVVMWSYPIIRDGLIYVTDVRNGLYILEYKGPHEEEVEAARFLEGNSNLGDASS